MCDYTAGTAATTCKLCQNTAAYADTADTVCPLATSRYPMYVAINLFPNTWDQTLSSSH